MTFVAADQLDVCAMFEEEVDQALAEGWSWGGLSSSIGSVGGVQIVATKRDTMGDADTTDGTTLYSWDVRPRGGKPDRFKTVWFDANLDGKIEDESARPRVLGPDQGATTLDPPREYRQLNDLYDDNGDPLNDESLWQYFTDEDEDPVYGDFGKVDLYSRTALATDPSDTLFTGPDTTTEKIAPDGKADNYQGRKAEACDPDDGGEDACDAEWSMDYDVLFADGIFGCSTTRPVTISCEWDAQGLLDPNPPDTANPDLLAGRGANGLTNRYNFARCTAE